MYLTNHIYLLPCNKPLNPLSLTLSKKPPPAAAAIAATTLIIIKSFKNFKNMTQWYLLNKDPSPNQVQFLAKLETYSQEDSVRAFK